MDLIERFASFDEAVLRDAYATLETIYSPWFSDYYHVFILFRQAECRRFLQEEFKTMGSSKKGCPKPSRYVY